MHIAEIVVAGRTRKKINGIESLVESIRTIGMLHPVVVNTRKELVAGGRRLEAAKRLGWNEVPVRVVDSLDDALAALTAERDENTCREPLTPTEMVEIGRRIEELEKPKAEERKAKSRAKPGEKIGTAQGEGNFPSPTNQAENGQNGKPSKGKTNDKVGSALGVSGKTYEKAKKVKEAAESDPQKFGDLPAKMDTESVHAAHEEMKARQEESEEETDPGEEFVESVEKLCRDIDQIVKRMKELKQSKFAYCMHIDSAVSQVEAARKSLWIGRPCHPCPYCEANEASGCKACGNTNRVNKGIRDRGLDAVGGVK